MVLKGLFKRLVDGVDVACDFLNVFFRGVSAFDKMEFSSFLVGRVFVEFAV